MRGKGGPEAVRNHGGGFLKSYPRRLTKVKAVGATTDKLRIHQMRVFLDTEMSSADLGPPGLAMWARRNSRKITRVQCRDADLRDLVMGPLIRLDVDADKDHRVVEWKRRRK